MSEIHYTTGDATRPATDGRNIIAHICNDIGGWGKGFVGPLSSLARARKGISKVVLGKESAL